MKENQSLSSKKIEQNENTDMDSSNVEEVIQKVLDSKQTWTIQEKMPSLVDAIDNLKGDLKIFMKNCGFDILAILNEATDLFAETNLLVDEMKACRAEIEQETMAEILKSMENHDKIAKELEKVNFSLNIVTSTMQCGNYVKEFEEGREARSYSRAIESVCNLLDFTDQPADGFDMLDVYSQTKNNGKLILDGLRQDLNQEWDRMVSHTIKTSTRKTVITLNITIDDSSTCCDTLNALYISERLSDKIAEYAIFILKEVFMPTVKQESKAHLKTSNQIVVTINHSKPNCRPDYKDTILNVRLLINFFKVNLGVECSRSDFGSNMTLMTMFSKLIQNDLCNLLINECFIHTIPNNIHDLQCYRSITLEIEEFQNYLIAVDVFPFEGLSLLSYLDNIDVLFAERSSQHFLVTARSIMMKDLSITMSIGHENIPEDTLALEKTSVTVDSAEEALVIFEKTIPKSLFYFPRCLISRTAQELLDLVYVIMEQAVQCSDVVCKKLYYAVRLLFELYEAVVPYHHENYLQTIPQYVALFHNNCMYLAHNLQTLGDKWLTLMEGRELDYAIGFVDLVQKIRELGYKHLTIHLQQQRKQILDNIRSSDLNCIVDKDVLGDNAEAAVRQCLRQLQLLKNVWIGVFPSNVFTNLIATLVNMFLDELIHRVCTVEDISIELASQLTDMYAIVVQKVPQMFATPTDVDKYVKSWIKLQELIFILKGSLKDIENHWNEGTGPLAVHFEVEELRSLIKALFQNTQFRANLLSKIK